MCLRFCKQPGSERRSGRNSVFHIQKQEGNSVAIESVSVDSQEVPFELEEGYLRVSVAYQLEGPVGL